METVVRGYKTDLDLNNEQRTACLKHAGASRFAYNWGLARSQEVYRTTGKRPNAIALHKELNKLKQTDYPWMYEVSKCAPQEALRDLDTAYKNFYRRATLKKQGKLKGKVGFPICKKRSKGIGSFRLTGSIKVSENSVQLPRIGKVRLHERGYIQKRLKRLERQKSRRKKGSKNRKKTVAKLAKQHARVASIRKDTSHKLTSYLCKNHALVAIEDLHVAGMVKNHKLAQAVSDSNFGEIRRQLEYKAQWHGVHLVVIDRFYPSSQLCSNCEWKNETLTLKDRVFVCQDCGAVTDRDYNAAQNLRNVAVSSIDTQNACGQKSAGLLNGASETVLGEAGTNQHLGVS